MRACSILRRHLHSSAKSIPLVRPQIACIRSHSYLHPYSTPRPKEASTFWITFSILAIGGGTWLHNYFSSQDSPFTPSKGPAQEPFLGRINTLDVMSLQPAPGTISTLTPEQEVKLREFWILALKVFGVKLDALNLNAKPTAEPSAAEKEKDKGKKKSKHRWFGRGGDDEEDTKSVTSVSSNLASINITDGDDKYGQSKEFQQALQEMTPDEIRTSFWNMVKHDNPDSLLLRFLRARKWDVNKALIMLISTMRWRLQDVHVDDDVMANGEAQALKQSQSSDPIEKKNGEEFLLQMRLGKSFLHGVDKFGRPICVVRVRLHRAGDQQPEPLERFTVYTIETARLLLNHPVETATIIFDMTGFGLANMDYTPVKFMIKCFEANYPESLGAVLIHKAPWVFSSIWSVIKGWLDPVVASKINFTKNREDLEAFIAPGQIMKELDGDEQWEYEYKEPQKDENIKMEDTETRDALLAERQKLAVEIQDTTIEWIGASLKKETEAVSAVQEKRNDLIAQLRKQYWELDPYIRTRSLYDRINIIQPGGTVEFYPAAENADSKEVAA
ncbi:hypothetical protein N7495_003524 [Penicillium taxi]|uniref:uncharacterized protein n=1 Tax=Penicillium taxi TaxID=168475 RepID=UPI0025458AEF|nr:uncharacterized protein N7495_003524 [Penicillium taxi]KAJ5898780.1 hypothetical protein N7495_003524 [Penicillium taxi]